MYGNTNLRAQVVSLIEESNDNNNNDDDNV